MFLFYLILFFTRYSQVNTCSPILQYITYVDSYCYRDGKASSFIYHYPQKISYAGSTTCTGSSSSSVTLQTDTCFDWISTYGIDTNDDTVTATLMSFSRYVKISSFSPISGELQFLYFFWFIKISILFYSFSISFNCTKF
jgi:hypothetical protein